jgi:hypothetical protein
MTSSPLKKLLRILKLCYSDEANLDTQANKDILSDVKVAHDNFKRKILLSSHGRI